MNLCSTHVRWWSVYTRMNNIDEALYKRTEDKSVQVRNVWQMGKWKFRPNNVLFLSHFELDFSIIRRVWVFKAILVRYILAWMKVLNQIFWDARPNYSKLMSILRLWVRRFFSNLPLFDFCLSYSIIVDHSRLLLTILDWGHSLSMLFILINNDPCPSR